MKRWRGEAKKKISEEENGEGNEKRSEKVRKQMKKGKQNYVRMYSGTYEYPM